MLNNVLNALRPAVVPAPSPRIQPAVRSLDAAKLAGDVLVLSKAAKQPAKTVDYTTKFDHPVSELAAQLGVDEAALRKANGWPAAGNPVIPAGTTIRVPDTEASRAAIAALNGGTAQGATSTPPPAAEPTSTQPAGKGAVADPNRVHYISQYHPDGEDATYDNDTSVDGQAGASQCGATSLAMVARFMGYGSDQTDAQLIETMGGLAGTDRVNGSSPWGVYQATQAAGWNSQPPVEDAADKKAEIDAALQSGQVLIANGNYYAMYGMEGNGGHFIVVTGMTDDGRYIIQDPAKDVGGDGQAVTWEQLQAFFATHDTGDGGSYVAVSPKA